MCIYIYIYTHTYICIYECVDLSLSLYIYIYIYICIHIHIHIHMYLCIYIYICMDVYIYIYMYLYIHKYIYIYIYVLRDTYIYIYIYIYRTTPPSWASSASCCWRASRSQGHGNHVGRNHVGRVTCTGRTGCTTRKVPLRPMAVCIYLAAQPVHLHQPTRPARAHKSASIQGNHLSHTTSEPLLASKHVAIHGDP